jgi:hypothetical protein
MTEHDDGSQRAGCTKTKLWRRRSRTSDPFSQWFRVRFGERGLPSTARAPVILYLSYRRDLFGHSAAVGYQMSCTLGTASSG